MGNEKSITSSIRVSVHISRADTQRLFLYWFMEKLQKTFNFTNFLSGHKNDSSSEWTESQLNNFELTAEIKN